MPLCVSCVRCYTQIHGRPLYESTTAAEASAGEIGRCLRVYERGDKDVCFDYGRLILDEDRGVIVR